MLISYITFALLGLACAIFIHALWQDWQSKKKQ
jgi:hypothetical protein